MASTAAIHESYLVTADLPEGEPLLGRPGDVVQKESESIGRNLITGERIGNPKSKNPRN